MAESVHLRILVIEDDPRMVDLLRRGLWDHGHSVVTAATAQEGQDLADEHDFDAIVLDIGLPDRSGFTVAAHLSQRADRPAIVMLTALNEEDHIVSGLDIGADDYLTKPFSFAELLARLACASRRSSLHRAGEIPFCGFTLDLKQHRLLHNHTEVRLTRSEYLLLRELALYCGEVVPRRKLMEAVWGTTQVTQGALDTLMASLREKLHEGQPEQHATDLVITLRGLGYMLLQEPSPARSKR
jgi:DNA-binding response OmpR family regulator